MIEEIREKDTKFNIIEKKLHDIMGQKSQLESELKILKLTINLDKMGNVPHMNVKYKNMIIGFRNE